MQPMQSEGNLNTEEITSENKRAAQPIAEFVARPDFPQCAVGQLVDIGGYVCQVTEIVKQSLKVKSPEGASRSFNYNALIKLYGPRIEPTPFPEAREPEAATSEETAPAKNVITEPNFAAPVKPISEFTKRPDFPKCTFGEHVSIADYTGVVVEIVSHSLKVRSQEEVTRSYNAEILKKLYGK